MISPVKKKRKKNKLKLLKKPKNQKSKTINREFLPLSESLKMTITSRLSLLLKSVSSKDRSSPLIKKFKFLSNFNKVKKPSMSTSQFWKPLDRKTLLSLEARNSPHHLLMKRVNSESTTLRRKLTKKNSPELFRLFRIPPLKILMERLRR